MHIRKSIFLSLLLGSIVSCAIKQRQQEIVSQIQTVTTQKIKAEKDLADFKMREGRHFKEYDSLKAKGLVTTELQLKHDSLFAEGINLAMKIVHIQMKIDSLQK